MTEIWTNSFNSKRLMSCFNQSVTNFRLSFSGFSFSARIGKMKRRKPEDGGQVCPLCSAPLTGSEEEMSRHVEQCLIQVVKTPTPSSRTACPHLSLAADSHSFTSCRRCPVTSEHGCRATPPVAVILLDWIPSTWIHTAFTSYGNNCRLTTICLQMLNL